MPLPGVLLAVCLAAVFLFVVNDTTWQTVDDAPAVTGVTELGEALLEHVGAPVRDRVACC